MRSIMVQVQGPTQISGNMLLGRTSILVLMSLQQLPRATQKEKPKCGQSWCSCRDQQNKEKYVSRTSILVLMSLQQLPTATQKKKPKCGQSWCSCRDQHR